MLDLEYRATARLYLIPGDPAFVPEETERKHALAILAAAASRFAPTDNVETQVGVIPPTDVHLVSADAWLYTIRCPQCDQVRVNGVPPWGNWEGLIQGEPAGTAAPAL